MTKGHITSSTTILWNTINTSVCVCVCDILYSINTINTSIHDGGVATISSIGFRVQVIFYGIQYYQYQCLCVNHIVQYTILSIPVYVTEALLLLAVYGLDHIAQNAIILSIPVCVCIMPYTTLHMTVALLLQQVSFDTVVGLF